MRHEVNLPYKAMRNRFARCRVVMVWVRISRIYETRELGVKSSARGSDPERNPNKYGSPGYSKHDSF